MLIACFVVACTSEPHELLMQDLPGLQAVKACLEEKHTAHFLECALTINPYLPARQVEDTFAVLKCVSCRLHVLALLRQYQRMLKWPVQHRFHHASWLYRRCICAV